MRRSHVPVDPGRGAATSAIAEEAQDGIVERTGTVEIGDAEIDMVNPAPHARYSPCPPATEMVCPVTHDANGEARNNATLAISSAWPMRPNGIEASVAL
jgi:hypothetical protein